MKNNNNKVVAVGGPPHSGKSVFLAELYRQILARRPSRFCFLQRACPDGEGMWSAETTPEIVREIRRKGNFSQEFMLFILKSIESLGKVFPLVLLDLGGRRTAENAEILQRSTQLILISSKEEEDEKWVKFAFDEGCETIAVLRSSLIKTPKGELNERVRSGVNFDSFPVRGEILNLDREGPVEPYREAISQFADWLIKRVETTSLS